MRLDFLNHWVNRFFPIRSRRLRRKLRESRERRVRPGFEILEDRTVPSTALGLTFDSADGPLRELPLHSYTWNVGSGPDVGEFSVSLAGSEVEPGLWGHLAAGAVIPSATIHARTSTGVEYASYTFNDVAIASFSTSYSGDGTPEDSISLNFARVSQTFHEMQPDGSPGTKNTTTYDVTDAKFQTLGDISLGGSTSLTPRLGLTLVENGVAYPEKDITSYSWNASNDGSVADFSEFEITLGASAAEPAFWGYAAGGKTFDSAIVHVRGSKGEEYLTYTLTDVAISSFGTSAESGEVPSDTLALHFDTVAETAIIVSPEGKLGGSNSAGYDVKGAKSLAAGNLSVGGSTEVAPRLGLTLVEDGVVFAEKDIQSFQWGIGLADEGSRLPSLSDVTLTLDGTDAEPGFWGHLAAGKGLDEAIIHVRDSQGVEYATYTITGVHITKFSTSLERGESPEDSISLGFDTFAESFRDREPQGKLGPANTAQYDLEQAKLEGTIDLSAGASQALAPQLGLTIVENGVTYPEKDFSAFSWDAGFAKSPHFSDFSLSLYGSALQPTLWGYLVKQAIADSSFDSVMLHARDSMGREYLTYTLTNVVISSFATSVEVGEVPSDSFTLRYGTLEETLREVDSKGGLSTPNTAKYDLIQDKLVAAGSLDFGKSTRVRPELGLTLIEGGEIIAEKDLSGFSWSVANSSGIPNFSAVELSLGATAAEPAFWARLADRTRLDQAIIHVRDSRGTEYATYTLTDVHISSFSTSVERGEAPSDTLELQFGKVQESFTEIDGTGKAGVANTAEYDLSVAVLKGTNRLDVGGSLAVAPRLGLTLVVGGVTLPEKDLQDYSWNVERVGGISVADGFEIDVPKTVAEPGFWGHVASPDAFDRAIIRLRDNDGRVYATYTLKNASFSDFSSGDGESIGLTVRFDEITESRQTIEPDGRLGPTNTASYNFRTQKSDGTGDLGTFATTTALSTSSSTTVYSQPVTFTATVSASGGIPAGNVHFLDGTTDLSGPIALATVSTLQQASFTIDSLSVGSHSITAVYDGTEVFLSSNSSALMQSVAPGSTTTTVTSSKPSSIYGDSLTFAAHVSPVAPSSAPPVGTVRFFDGATDLSGPIPLGGQQQASFTVNSLGAGSHTITAVFEDATGNYTGSSGMVSQSIARATLIVTADDQTRIQGEANPAFTVSFSGFVLGQDPGVLGGTLTFTTTATPSSPPGTYSIVPGGLTSDNYDIHFVSGTLTVLSFADATGNLVDQVKAAGLSGGRSNSLLSSLQAAIDSFDRGNTKAGINQLQAFVNKVLAQRGKSIDPALADSLIAAAERIITAVEAWSLLSPSRGSGRR